eukprot:gene19943-26651_t
MRMPGGPKAAPSLEPGAEMTLAQKLGLIPKPAPLLTEQEWDDQHLKSRLRQDSDQECPICREQFKEEAQVLLSCSHVFHKACLTSFEKFAHTRSCPLCRATRYQKKAIQDGKLLWKQQCATLIQAHVRGYLARLKYKKYRRHNAPSNPALKRKWASERLQEENDRMLKEMDDEVGDIDALFAELDASLAESRKVGDIFLSVLSAALSAEARLNVSLAESQKVGDLGDEMDDELGDIDALFAELDASLAESRKEMDDEVGDIDALFAVLDASLAESRKWPWFPELFAVLDASLAESRKVCEALDGPVVRRYHDMLSAEEEARRSVNLNSSRDRVGASNSPDVVPNPSSRPLSSYFRGGRAAASTSASSSTAPASHTPSAGREGQPGSGASWTAPVVDWVDVVTRAKARAEHDCPICIGPLDRRGQSGWCLRAI